METDDELPPNPGSLLKGLGKTIAAIAGIVAALSILPALPYAVLSGMETNRAARMALAYAPLLFAISAVAAIFCIARITVLRFLLAVVPVTFVFLNWLL